MDERRASSGTFRKVVTLQIALLCALLGLWGFNRIAKSNLTPEAAAVRTAAPTAPILANTQPPRPRPVAMHTATPRERRDSSSQYWIPTGPLTLRNPTLLIEKVNRRLVVFDGDDVVAIYPAAVGGDLGDKEIEGDCRTPEGEFYVCVKNDRSRFVLSLGLSYPNFEDAERGLQQSIISHAEYRLIVDALRAGRRPPWNTGLGGEIMIHGRRDGGRTTLGCIALEDDHIRQLFPAVPNGTRVHIRK